jgi:hypothetical protein
MVSLVEKSSIITEVETELKSFAVDDFTELDWSSMGLVS